MNTEFTRDFLKDVAACRDEALRGRVESVILRVEEASDLSQLPGVRPLRGAAGYFRIRVGEYRVAFTVEADLVTFVRFMHRKDIYRHVP